MELFQSDPRQLTLESNRLWLLQIQFESQTITDEGRTNIWWFNTTDHAQFLPINWRVCTPTFLMRITKLNLNCTFNSLDTEPPTDKGFKITAIGVDKDGADAWVLGELSSDGLNTGNITEPEDDEDEEEPDDEDLEEDEPPEEEQPEEPIDEWDGGEAGDGDIADGGWEQDGIFVDEAGGEDGGEDAGDEGGDVGDVGGGEEPAAPADPQAEPRTPRYINGMYLKVELGDADYEFDLGGVLYVFISQTPEFQGNPDDRPPPPEEEEIAEEGGEGEDGGDEEIGDEGDGDVPDGGFEE